MLCPVVYCVNGASKQVSSKLGKQDESKEVPYLTLEQGRILGKGLKLRFSNTTYIHSNDTTETLGRFLYFYFSSHY